MRLDGYLKLFWKTLIQILWPIKKINILIKWFRLHFELGLWKILGISYIFDSNGACWESFWGGRSLSREILWGRYLWRTNETLTNIVRSCNAVCEVMGQVSCRFEEWQRKKHEVQNVKMEKSRVWSRASRRK